MTRTRILTILTAGCLIAASCAGSDEASDTTVVSTDSTDVSVKTGPSATDSGVSDPVDTDPVDTDPAESEPEIEAPPETEPPPATEAPPSTEASAELPIDAQAITVQPRGTDALVSTQSFDDTVAAAVAAIEGNENLTLVATIDHSVNANAAGLALPPTTELIFGNPALGTPIIALEPTAGIDLPQKMLIVEDLDGTVTVSWNRSDYLASRHGLSLAVAEQLATINDALRSLGTIAAAAPADAAPIESVTVVGEGEGLVETTAPGTARDATDRLLAAIEGNENLTLVAEVDHAANATGAGLELTPVIEVIFGNPAAGTPLMLASRSVGIDLPQKMLFIEDGDSVRIVYNDPDFIAKRHKIDRDAALLTAVTEALEDLALAAAG